MALHKRKTCSVFPASFGFEATVCLLGYIVVFSVKVSLLLRCVWNCGGRLGLMEQSLVTRPLQAWLY